MQVFILNKLYYTHILQKYIGSGMCKYHSFAPVDDRSSHD